MSLACALYALASVDSETILKFSDSPEYTTKFERINDEKIIVEAMLAATAFLVAMPRE